MRVITWLARNQGHRQLLNYNWGLYLSWLSGCAQKLTISLAARLTFLNTSLWSVISCRSCSLTVVSWWLWYGHCCAVVAVFALGLVRSCGNSPPSWGAHTEAVIKTGESSEHLGCNYSTFLVTRLRSFWVVTLVAKKEKKKKSAEPCGRAYANVVHIVWQLPRQPGREGGLLVFI